MKKKIFYIVFALIILSALRFYYIEFERGFNQCPKINNKENTFHIALKVD
jgi:hypothetical protein